MDKKINKPSEQVKASTAYIVCSVLQKALSFILTPIFSNLMTTEEYGLSTVYTSTMSVRIILTTLQLPYGSFPRAMIRFEKDRKGYVSAINGLVTLISLIIFAIYFPLRNILNGLLDLPTILMSVMCVEMIMNNALNLWMGMQRFEYKYKSVVFVTLLMSIATSVIGLISVKAAATPDGRAMAKTLSASLVAILIGFIIYVYSIVRGKKFYDKTYWGYALRMNIPLLPYYLSQVIFNHSDKLMINRFCGRGEAAKYGIAYSIAIIIIFVINAINNAYTPWFYSKFKARDVKDNRKVSLGIAVLIGFMLLGVIAVSPELMLIMNKDYYDALWIIPPVSMSLFFLFYTQLFLNVEFYYESMKNIVMASIYPAVLNIVLNYFLLPVFDYYVAGYTTLISYVAFALANYLYARKLRNANGIDLKEMFDIRGMLILLAVFLTCGFILLFLYKLPVVRYALVVIVFALCAVNYRKIYKAVIDCVSLFR